LVDTVRHKAAIAERHPVGSADTSHFFQANAAINVGKEAVPQVVAALDAMRPDTGGTEPGETRNGR
jgi:hypothetical protein